MEDTGNKLITFKIPILIATKSYYSMYLYTTAVKIGILNSLPASSSCCIGILNVIEFITSIFILFKCNLYSLFSFKLTIFLLAFIATLSMHEQIKVFYNVEYDIP